MVISKVVTATRLSGYASFGGRTTVISGVATLLAVVLAVLGRWAVAPGIAPWSRVWADVFFILLLWPVGLALVGRRGGWRAQAGVAALLLLASLGQAVRLGSLPLPLVVRWSATLASPGDAVRQRVLLPAPADGAWQRAWQRASHAVVAVCTEQALQPEAGTELSLNGASPVPLATLARIGKPLSVGWYYLPITRAVLEKSRTLEVVVRRTSASGGAVTICGGQDDPGRQGAGGAARWRNGAWRESDLADQEIPALSGRVPPQHYYVELRFLDEAGLPHVAIWY